MVSLSLATAARPKPETWRVQFVSALAMAEAAQLVHPTLRVVRLLANFAIHFELLIALWFVAPLSST